MAATKKTFLLDRAQLADLLFAAEKLEALEAVVVAGSQLTPSTSIVGFAESVAETTKLPVGDVERLIEVVLSYMATREMGKFSPGEIVEGIQRNLTESKSVLHSDAQAIWDKATAKFCQIMEFISADHPFQVLRKAKSVVYAHQNILTSIRVITDLRPVFDDGGQKILHTVISHKLIIAYNDGFRGRRIEFGIDAADLADMRQFAERAQVKAITLQDAMKDAPWKVSLQLDE